MSQHLSVRLGENQTLRFDDFAAASTWVETERAAWSWLAGASRGLGIQDPMRPLNVQFKSIADSLKQLESPISGSERKRAWNSVESNLKLLYAGGSLFETKDPRTKYIELVRGTHGDEVAAATFIALATRPKNQNLPFTEHLVRGIVLAEGYRRPNKERAQAELAAIESAHSEWEQLADDTNQRFEAFNTSHNRIVVAARQELQELEQIREEQQAAYKAELASAQEDLEALKKLYSDKLALREPVSYWKNRARASHQIAAVWSLLFLGLTAGSATWAWSKLRDLILPANVSEAIEHWQALLLVVAFGTVIMWPLRILSRLLLSSLHVATDAQERATMTMTYLALVQEDRHAGDADRRFVLEALFRPSRFGIVKDDAAPPSVVKIASDLTKGDS